MPTSTLRQMLASIRTDLDSGALAGALSGLKAVMRAAPLESEAHFLLGAYFWRRGQYERATAAMKWAALCDPSLPGSWENLAQLEFTGQSGSHIASYRRAVVAGADTADLAARVHVPRRPVLVRAGLCFDPDDAHLAAMLAFAAVVRAGEAVARRRMARARIIAAASRKSDLIGRLSLAWGRRLQTQGHYSGAMAPLRQAVVLDPSDAERYFDLGRSLMEAGLDNGAGQMVSRSLMIRSIGSGFTYRETRRLVDHHPLRIPARPGYQCVELSPAFPVSITPTGQPAPRIEYDVPATFLARADDALMLAGHHSVILPGGEVLMDGLTYRQKRRRWDGPCYAYVGENGAVFAALPVPETRIAGEAVLLGGGGNYYHNVVDWLSRLPAILDNPALSGLPLLISDGVPGSVVEILEMTGVARDRLRFLEPGLYPVESLWIPSLAHGRLGCVSPRYLEFLEERLFSRFRNRSTRGSRRFYFGRRGDRHRRIVNADALLEMLDGFGFESIELEQLSAREQFSLCADAEVIVAPFGAGLTNILACPETTLVIELTHPQAIRPLFPVLAGLRGQPFHRITGPIVRSGDPALPLHADFEIPAVELKTLLEKVLAQPRGST